MLIFLLNRTSIDIDTSILDVFFFEIRIFISLASGTAKGEGTQPRVSPNYILNIYVLIKFLVIYIHWSSIKLYANYC
jgi:hypothetical protein